MVQDTWGIETGTTRHVWTIVNAPKSVKTISLISLLRPLYKANYPVGVVAHQVAFHEGIRNRGRDVTPRPCGPEDSSRQPAKLVGRHICHLTSSPPFGYAHAGHPSWVGRMIPLSGLHISAA
jgi:hypothetical protein